LSMTRPGDLAPPFCACCSIICWIFCITFCCSAGLIALKSSSLIPSWLSIALNMRSCGVSPATLRNWSSADGFFLADVLPSKDDVAGTGDEVIPDVEIDMRCGSLTDKSGFL